VLDTMLGCPMDCSYCYLQLYQNVKAILGYVNLEQRLKELVRKLRRVNKFLRIGNGEFCDSLVLEDVYPQTELLYYYFKDLKKVFLEFKTKSKNIDIFNRLKPSNNFIISWSLNPQTIIEKEEKNTASLHKRLEASSIVSWKGWRVGFHFDPLIYFRGWQDAYLNIIKLIKKNVAFRNIAWISLGTLRFPPSMYYIIEERFPSSIFLDSEFVLADDNKLRYLRKTRVEMYKFMLRNLRKYLPDVDVYLCMETSWVWKEVFGFVPSCKEDIFTHFLSKIK